MSDSDGLTGDHAITSPTATEALHTTLDMDFEDAVPFVQLEHELGDFETVKVTRLDQMIEVVLDEEVDRTALLVVCHPEIARDALRIDHCLAGMLPCTTVVYERPDDDLVHVHHYSATKAIRDLGCAPDADEEALDRLVTKTGELMAQVWANIEHYAETRADDES